MSNNLDPIIHAPNRLQICAMLMTSAELDFKLLKEELSVSDSVMSKHLKTLEDASYIKTRKRKEFGRPTTWVSLTAKGRAAFTHHVDALKAIVSNL